MILRTHALALFTGLSAAAGGATLASSAGPRTVAETVIYRPYGPTYCAKCEDCNPAPGEGGHIVFPHDTGSFNATHEHQCLGPWTVAQGACTNHEGCATGGGGAFARPTPEEIDRIFGDPTQAALLLARYPEAVKLNAVRGAIQFVGCENGTLIGNLQISPELIAQLAEVEGSLSD